MKFTLVCFLALALFISLTSAGGGGMRGRKQRDNNAVRKKVILKYKPYLVPRYITRNQVVPVPHPVFIPIPIGGGGGGSDSQIVVIGSGSGGRGGSSSEER